MNVNIGWSSDIVKQFEESAKAVRRGLWRGLSQWGSGTAKALKAVAAKKVRRGIFSKASGLTAGKHSVLIQSTSPIGRFLEYGTGLYGPKKKRIKAKGGPYTDALGRRRKHRLLRWVSEGTEHYAFSVAGMRARPWFLPTIEKRLKVLNGDLRQAVAKEIASTRARAAKG